MDILNNLIGESRKDYKCFSELRRLYESNEEFRNACIEGFLNGKVSGFDDGLWEKINKQNIRGVDNFETVFKDGANLGYCTVASRQLSYSFHSCYICGGLLPILKGTINCAEGEHTWIFYEGNIIDTTLMLVIDKDYADKFGYIEENRYNPNQDFVYAAAKEFATDENLRKK